MTITAEQSTDLVQLRHELVALRDEIEDMRQHLRELETVKEAEQDYARRLADVDSALADVKRQLQEKEAEKARLERRLQPRRPPGPPPIRRPRTWPDGHRPPSHGQDPVRPTGMAGAAARHSLSSDAGQRFKEMVRRWYRQWGLNRETLSRINRIADNPETSPGEALLMLDWSLFKGPALPDETEEEQLVRLTEWHEMLIQYHDQLAGEIDTQELRSKGVLGIWEWWRTRDLNDAWQIHIAQTIQDRQDEIDEVKTQIAERESEIADLQSQLAARSSP